MKYYETVRDSVERVNDEIWNLRSWVCICLKLYCTWTDLRIKAEEEVIYSNSVVVRIGVANKPEVQLKATVWYTITDQWEARKKKISAEGY